MAQEHMHPAHYGMLAEQFCGLHLPLTILRSNAGFYIGTADNEGPVSRESVEYFPSNEDAASALANGEWTQKMDL